MTEKKPTIAKKKPAVKKPVATKKVTSKEEDVVSDAPVKTAAPNGRYFFATGRRKTAVATVRLFASAGEHQVNRKPFVKYFDRLVLQNMVNEPLKLTGKEGESYAQITVNGGGIKAQAEASRHAIARALLIMDEELRRVLKQNGFLTRDDRKKERKKPGLRRARRAPQWAKR